MIISFSIHHSPWFLKASHGFQKEGWEEGREGWREGALQGSIHLQSAYAFCFLFPSLSTLQVNMLYFSLLCRYTRLPLVPMFLHTFFPLHGIYRLLFQLTAILFLRFKLIITSLSSLSNHLCKAMSPVTYSQSNIIFSTKHTSQFLIMQFYC